MLKIEEYGGLKVDTQIVPASRRSADVPRGAFDSTSVANVANTAENIYSHIAKTQQRVADTEAEDALNKFERDKNALFFDPEKGYFNSQGRDAIDRAPDVNKQLENLKTQYSNTLKSDSARQSFSRVVDKHITSAQQDIMRHSSKNLDAWENATAKSQIENSLENASLYWNDDGKLAVQRELGRDSVLRTATKEGLSPETINERLQTYNSSFASSAIKAATMSNSTQGQQLLDKYKSQLEGPDVVTLNSLIEARQKTEKTKYNADIANVHSAALLTEYGDRPDARSVILDEVNKIEDETTRKHVMKETMHQLDVAKKAKSEEAASIFDNASKFISGGGTALQFQSQNPNAWEKMTADQQRKVSSGKAVVNDYNTYFSLVGQGSQKLAEVNPSDYVSDLDKAHLDKLTTAVLNARKGLADGQTSRDSLKKDRIEELTGIKNPRTKVELEKFNSMNRVVDAMLDSRMKENGKTYLGDDDYRKVLSDFSRSYVRERAVLPDKSEKLTDIPTNEIEAYSNYLRENKLPVTTKNLLQIKNNAAHRDAALKRSN